MELKVINALSRDVEREQLNKILKYISDTLLSVNSGGITEAQVRALIAESLPTVPSPRPITVTLTGDATGEGIGTTSISIPVELTGNFVEDAPSDSLPYWRQDGQWSMVPFPLLSLSYLSPSGFGAYNEEELEWNSRVLTGTTGNIVVTNGDGILGDPVFDLALVPNSNTGALLAITRDGFGRVTGTKPATITGPADQIVVYDGDAIAGLPTISLADVVDTGTGTLQKTKFDSKGRKTGTATATTDDLSEGGTNLYFTDVRADARAALAMAAHVAEVDPHPQYAKDAEVLHIAGGHAAGSVSSNGYFGSGGSAWKGPPLYGAGMGNGLWAQASGMSSRFSCFSADAPSQFLGFRSSGTVDTPGATPAQVGLFDLYGAAFDGASWRYACSLAFLTNEATSAAGSGTFAAISTTLNGTNSLQRRLEIGRFGSAVSPGQDASQRLGVPAYRWSEVWVASGAISPSDAREKTTVRAFTPAEIAAAIELGGEIGVYQWLAMIEQKGDAARQHIGMTVQGAIAILESHSLDPFAYGFICYDEWPELPEIRNDWSATPQVVDAFGNLVQEARDAGSEVVQEHRPAGDRYSFRMDELLAFIARGITYRLKSIEDRLDNAGL